MLTMKAGFPLARMKGARSAIIDVMFAITMLATLATLILTLLQRNAQEDLARAYARQFRITAEDSCPRSLGKPFWFTCASEVRSRSAPPAA